MHSQLRERIRLMRARLDNAAPVAEIRAESQQKTAENPRPVRAGRKGGKALRALKK
ncbi:hypothetical protein ESCOMM100M1_24485 [Escherichia coli]